MTNRLTMMGYEFRDGRIVGATVSMTIGIVFSSMVFSAARFFESSGVAQ